MKMSIRIGIWIALLSLTGMFLFDFSAADFHDAPLIGRINLIALPLILFVAAFFEDSVIIDKKSRTITTKKGLLFLFRKRDAGFNDIESIIVKSVMIPSRTRLALTGESRYFVGIVAAGKNIPIGRGLSSKTKDYILSLLQLFIDREIPISE